MRINSEKLKAAATRAGVGVEDLAQAVERGSLSGQKARSAVGNWMRGADHPRCKAEDIRRLAESLGCPVPEIARFTSQVRHHRGSSRKARLLADLIRGKKADEAMNLLTFTPKRAAVNMKKALLAAMADAEMEQADFERLVVSQSIVEEGPHIKRFRPKDRGRAHPILKRTSHITVGVEER